MKLISAASAAVALGLSASPRAASAAPAPAPSPARTQAGQTRVCVDVQLKSWREAAPVAPAPPPASAPAAPSAPAEPPPPPPAAESAPPPSKPLGASAAPNGEHRREDPFAVQPERFLKRMVEYEVTHDEGAEAVSEGCQETLTVEMYPLPDGWTVFARFTGTAREEKVDRVQADELAQLAQRLTAALLHDRSIQETISRQTVLRADSEARLRMVDGRGYWTLGMGTTLRAAQLPTAERADELVEEQWRLVTPLDLQIGYRVKFQAWGLDAFIRGMLGLNERAVGRNDFGGHADYGMGLQTGLHFLRYLAPEAMNSLYLGGGASFELSSFRVIKSRDRRGYDDRESLLTGGLNADLLIGYEFMRASAVHFFIQGDLQLPTYFIDTENSAGGVETYAPGAVLQIGLVF